MDYIIVNTILGTLLQSNAVQYNSSAINFTFMKFIVQFLLTLFETCKLNSMAKMSSSLVMARGWLSLNVHALIIFNFTPNFNK